MKLKSVNGDTPNAKPADYKLFEANEIAKYGIYGVAGNLLSPIAYKALMFLICKCNQITPGVFDTLEIPLDEFGQALGYDKHDENRHFNRDVKLVCKTLAKIMSNPVMVYDKERKCSSGFVFIYEFLANHDTGKLKVKFSNAVGKYFGAEIKQEFTVVRLKYLNRLTTTGAVILYPFFCRYLSQRFLRYSVEEMKKLLTRNVDYKYKYFKRDILLPAFEQINALTDIHVDMTEFREGRQVTNLDFVIRKDPAFDEKQHYADYNGLKHDEYDDAEYNDVWMTAYTYDMGTQQYRPS